MDITGYAIITGASSGIGACCARAFAREGAAGVALLDLNSQGLQTIKAEVASLAKDKARFRALVFTLDVSREEEVNAAIEATAADFGRIDYVANCAGIPFKHEGGAAFAQTHDWQRVLDINLNGTFFVLRAVAKIMLKQDALKSSLDGRDLQRGCITNISSVMGVLGIAQSTAYCASKHAVIGLTKTASEDYARKGLRINAVCPGYIDTPLRTSTPEIAAVMKERSEIWTPMGRLGRPEEIADAVIFLSGGRSSYITGSTLMVDGGYSSH